MTTVKIERLAPSVSVGFCVVRPELGVGRGARLAPNPGTLPAESYESSCL